MGKAAGDCSRTPVPVIHMGDLHWGPSSRVLPGPVWEINQDTGVLCFSVFQIQWGENIQGSGSGTWHKSKNATYGIHGAYQSAQGATLITTSNACSCVPWELASGMSNAWVPVIHMGDPDWIPSPWFHLDPALAIVGIWDGSRWGISLPAFQRNNKHVTEFIEGPVQCLN